jgi:hypothetical protein
MEKTTVISTTGIIMMVNLEKNSKISINNYFKPKLCTFSSSETNRQAKFSSPVKVTLTGLQQESSQGEGKHGA